MFCSNCGAQCNNDAKFCTNCGSSLLNIQSSDKSVNTGNNKKSKIIKLITITGIVLFSVIAIIFLLYLIAMIADINNLHVPKTSIMPIIVYLFFIVSSVLGIIGCVKKNKKFLIISISMLIISCILYSTTKYVNRSIINKTYSTVSYSDLINSNIQKDTKVQISGEVFYCDNVNEDIALINISSTSTEQIVAVINKDDETIEFNEGDKYTFFCSYYDILESLPTLTIDWAESEWILKVNISLD